MHISLAFSCLLLLMLFDISTVQELDVNSIQNDIEKFNITCYYENCKLSEVDTLSYRSCYCGIQCIQMGTCCIDSHYVDVPQPKLKPTCRSIHNGGSYFMIDQCPSDSVWASSCIHEWNAEDNLQKLAPVTSFLTSLTYKNYYCLRCHETTDEFLYWTVKLESHLEQFKISADESEDLDRRISLNYNNDMNSWMVMFDEDVGYFPVNLSMSIPNEIRKLAHVCVPDVISDCSEKWSDEEMRNKCLSYTAIKEVLGSNIASKYYKNIHCALCNFESLDNLSCKSIPAGAFGVTRFSFSYLLDINRSDGELVGKIQKCNDDHVWDPYTEKCRKLTCVLPGSKIKNGKCVQE